MKPYENEIKKAAKILSQTDKAVAFCGAGVSQESGISTYRDTGGLWDKIDPMEISTTEGFINTLKNRSDILLPIISSLLESLEKADFNSGHKALFELEEMGVLKSVITQNVDNLHQEAGSRNVIEVHGNAFNMRCLSCDLEKKYNRKELVRDFKEKFFSLKEFSLENLISIVPKCSSCSFVMRPDGVMFGEAVKDLSKAFNEAATTDVILALGTSGVVYPVANLPVEAKNSGARVIVINPVKNGFKGTSDIFIKLKTGDALPKIVQEINDLKI